MDNRETLAGELLFVYDPTPGTWFWQWDNQMREDAPFAASLNLAYRHLPTTRDARFGVNEMGTFFAFDGAPAAEDLWDATFKWISSVGKGTRLMGTAFAGKAQSRGIDERLVYRYGGDFTLIKVPWTLLTSVSFNDWGPYDYHRDYNLTYPLQLTGDLAYSWGVKTPQTSRVRLGLRGLYRTLDQYSEGYLYPNRVNAGLGSEWEVSTYFHLDL